MSIGTTFTLTLTDHRLSGHRLVCTDNSYGFVECHALGYRWLFVEGEYHVCP